jgi:hypothetical protein
MSALLRLQSIYHVYLTKHILVSLNAVEKISRQLSQLFPKATAKQNQSGKTFACYSRQCAATLFPMSYVEFQRQQGIPFPYPSGCGKRHSSGHPDSVPFVTKRQVWTIHTTRLKNIKVKD